MAQKRTCQRCRARLPKVNFTWKWLIGNAELHPNTTCYACHKCQAEITAERAADPELARAWEMSRYRARDLALKSMGYASYADYLVSDRWQRIRARVLAAKKYTCQGCGGRAVLVHHSFYRKRELTGASLRGMKALCSDCHKRIEFDGDRKVGLVEATHRLVAMRS